MLPNSVPAGSSQPPANPGMQLRTTILGHQLAMAAFRAAVELELADRLGDRTRTSDAIAAEIGANAPAMYRLLRALAFVGVTEELPGPSFRLTPLGSSLRSDVKGSTAPFARFILRPYRGRAAEEVAFAVRSGQPAMVAVTGGTSFEYFARNPEEAGFFNAAMTSLASTNLAAILDAYDFSLFRCVADLGGGQGSLISGILAKYPPLKGILLDLPQVLAGAPALLARQGVADRCAVVGGSFFEAVPPGADAYVLRSVLHDWNDVDTVRILRSIRTVCGPETKILAIDQEIPASLEPHFSKLLDLNMMIHTGGRERTRAEFAELFQQAGFRLARVVPTRGPQAIFEGVPG
jgi:O-methyltransferase domain